MEKKNFYDLNFDQLKSFLIEKGEVEPKKEVYMKMIQKSKLNSPEPVPTMSK